MSICGYLIVVHIIELQAVNDAPGSQVIALSNQLLNLRHRNRIRAIAVHRNRYRFSNTDGVQNAEIHAMINRIEAQIRRLKDSDAFFTERDNFSAGHAFSTLQNNLYEQISKWRNKKTKVVGDDECAAAAVEYDVDIAKYLVSFVSSAMLAYIFNVYKARMSFFCCP